MANSKIGKWSIILGILLMFLRPSDCVQAAQTVQAEIDTIVAVSAEILYNNEGSYNSVNPNDNGAVSVGKLQWHGWRALSLLQTIVQDNEEQANELLGKTLYKEITTTSDTTKWSTRKLSSSEVNAVRKLLATEESKAAQDALAVKDITSYIQQGQRLGITNEPALVYFADLTNQGGAGASGRVAASASKVAGSYLSITLNELHEAAICDSVMGYSAYHNRRFATYKYAANLGWAYCNSLDSYIPFDYTSARDAGSAWLQRALNTCMDAGLAVTDVYDDATKEAVTKFQSAKSLEVDGYAGRETIVALIRAVVQKETVIPDPEIPSQAPNLPVQDPTTTEQNPGTITPEPTTPKPDTPVQEPDIIIEKPTQKAVLEASKTSYAINDVHDSFELHVTSNHTQSPITYQSSDESVAVVSEDGQVNITGAGHSEILVSQAQTDTYFPAELRISVTVYSTDPADYTVPTGALYAEKNMKKQQVQWLQAALLSLDGAEITVNGSWSKTMTQLVKRFQKKCGIMADGIAGTQTQDIIKNMLAVKTKKPKLTVKSNAKAITIAWKKYASANRVSIYRKEQGGSYQRIKTITNMKKNSYQDKSAKKGTTYSYIIKYGNKQNKITIQGPSSIAVAGALL